MVKNSNEFSNYLEQPNEKNAYETGQMLLRMATSKKNFYQIRFINNTGKEAIRVDNLNNRTYIVPDNELQNKSNRYYYTEASKLKNDEIFISDMDLNAENEKVEFPYKPMVRIATPIYSDENIYQGILVINYAVQEFLDIFHKQFEDSDYVFINL